MGLMAAVRWYLNLDHTRLYQTYEEQVAGMVAELSATPNLRAMRGFPNEAG